MSMNQINPNHKKERKVLRALGPMILFTGLVFVVVGFASVFGSIGGRGTPEYFWCIFVGMPLMFVGSVMTMLGFMGKVARYTAQEQAPVGVDTFNYMAEGTKEGVEDFSEALFTGKANAEAASIEDRIQRLEEMRKTGLIDDEDFEEQKDRILSEL